MPGITNPAEAYFKDGIWGWDGSVWRKLPLVWGYSDRLIEGEDDDDVSAGDHVLTFTTVPDGEVHVITSFTAWCTTANPTRVELRGILGGAVIFFWSGDYPNANYTVGGPMHIVLKKDDYLLVAFRDCVLNDDIRAAINGYKMKIAE